MSTLLKKSVNLKAAAKEYLKILASEKYLRYRIEETALQSLINKYPDNSDFNGVFIKVTMLNLYYNTRLQNSFIISVAKRIHGIKNFDKRLKEGDVNLLSDISIPNTKEEHKCFSFATKYCVLHNPDKFVIYDSIVRKALKQCRDEELISDYKAYEPDDYLKDIERYRKYMDVLKEFQQKCEIGSLRDLDWFLWTYGKENSKT